MKRTIAILAAIATGVVVLIAVIGGGSDAKRGNSAASPYGASQSEKAPAQAPAGSTITGRQTGLGKTLVDASGRTLYLFEADTADNSNCSGACLSVWPPLTATAKPRAGVGAAAAKIGTIPGPGGKRQVTYAKHPLYYYVADRKPGDTKGQGLNQFGAEWYALSPGGGKIDHD